MSEPFSISVDRHLKLLSFRCWGHWDLDTVQRFRAGLGSAMAPLVATGAAFDVFVDLSDFPPQPQVVAEQLQQSVTRAKEMGMRRGACLVQSALTKLQFARVSAFPHFRYFTAADEARAWLNEQRSAA
jgi:hypothetical protein